jgi:hypothetical protein
MMQKDPDQPRPGDNDQERVFDDADGHLGGPGRAGSHGSAAPEPARRLSPDKAMPRSVGEPAGPSHALAHVGD